MGGRHGQRTILKLNAGVPRAPQRRSHTGSSISVPRAVLMSPRSMTSVCPKLSSSSVTVALAASSLPETKTDDSCAEVLGVDHQGGVEGVEGLDDAGLREGALDLLAERVGVLDEQGGRQAGREVERVGDVEEDLAGEVVGAGQLERRDGAVPAGRVDDELSTCGGVGKGGQAGGRVGLEPGTERRVTHAVRLSAATAGLGVAGADDDVVAELEEAGGEGLADHAGAEDCDLHEECSW